MKTKYQTDKIFKEACIGYGFEEVEVSADGEYCWGCCYVHKRPTKMYSCYKNEKLCKDAVVKFYNPEDQ